MTNGKMIDFHEEVAGSKRFLILVLASTATVTSAGISIVAGWERGGSTNERIAWVFVGLVLLLSAHLIPALTKGLSFWRRAPALLIWAGAMFATGYGHATFFAFAQHDAGEERAAMIPLERVPVHSDAGGRSQTAIASDRATVDQQLAALDAQKCRDACTYLNYRRKTLTARREKLNVEMEDARRRYALEDAADADRAKTEARKEAAQMDPVTGLVSRVFKVQAASVNLGLSVFLGWLMESVACLAWSLALPRHSTKRAEPAPSTQSAQASSGDAEIASSKATGPDEEVDTGESTPVCSSPATVAVGGALAITRAANDDSSVDREVPGPVGAVANIDTPKSGAAALVSSGEVVREHDVDMDALSAAARGDVGEIGISEIERLAVGIRLGETDDSVAEIRRFFDCSEPLAQQIRWAYLARAPQDVAVG